jgi:hypothetical protein
MAQEKYREYVRDGIGGHAIWDDLEAQSLVGLEGFAEALKDHVAGKDKSGRSRMVRGLWGA